jgi:hypothetical protein
MLGSLGESVSDRIAWALRIWGEGRTAASAARAYLRSRGLSVADELAGRVLREHSKHGLVGLFRDINTDEPCGIQRVFISPTGEKIGRKMLGRSKGAAIKLDADEEVTYGLVIGEGVETCLAARQLGLKPVWALGPASAIGDFSVLSGINALTLLAERNKDGSPNASSQRNVTKCAARWHAAGREVIIVDAPAGDINDALLLRRVA